MNDSPVFSKVEADRILKRASEIEGAEDPRRLSLDELRLIAGEAGFGRLAVERAIAEAQVAGTVEVQRPAVRKSGLLVTHLSTTREIPTGLTHEQLVRVVRLFQPYRDGPARVKLEEHEITWQDRKGLEFAVTSVAGATEVRVFVSKLLLRRGHWMSWVKAAADRLEMLVLLVAEQGLPRRPPHANGRPPDADA